MVLSCAGSVSEPSPLGRKSAVRLRGCGEGAAGSQKPVSWGDPELSGEKRTGSMRAPAMRGGGGLPCVGWSTSCHWP